MTNRYLGVLLIAFLVALVWGAVEFFVIRSDAWTTRSIGKEMVVTSDNAQQHLRTLSQRLRDIERQGEREFGYPEWWSSTPPGDFALQLVRDPQAKSDFQKLRTKTSVLREELKQLIGRVGAIAQQSVTQETKDGLYQAQFIADVVQAMHSDLDELDRMLAAFLTYR